MTDKLAGDPSYEAGRAAHAEAIRTPNTGSPANPPLSDEGSRQSGPHTITECEYTDGWYHGRSTRRSGVWQWQFTCPACKRSGKFNRNFLGQRKVMCDGVKFTKILMDGLSVAGLPESGW